MLEKKRVGRFDIGVESNSKQKGTLIKHTKNPIIKHKAGLLNLIEELSNVSKASKVVSISRETFYRYQKLVETGGIDNLIDKIRRKANIKNRVDNVTEKAVLAQAIIQPAHGKYFKLKVHPLFDYDYFRNRIGAQPSLYGVL